jgi:membrane protein DedA with SNARE-associated domain
MDGSAALISVPLWVYLGFIGSQNRDTLLDWIKKGQIGTVAVVLAIVALFVVRYLLKRKKSKAA